MHLDMSTVSIPHVISTMASRDSYEKVDNRSPTKVSPSRKASQIDLPSKPNSPIKRPVPDRIVVNEVRFDTADTKLKKDLRIVSSANSGLISPKFGAGTHTGRTVGTSEGPSQGQDFVTK